MESAIVNYAGELLRTGLIVLMLAACTPTITSSVASDGSTSTTPELIGTVWQLTACTDQLGNLKSVLPGTQATATFNSTRFLTGSSGCNDYSTVFQTVDTTLSLIGPITATHRMCAQPVMDQEEAYFWALPRSTGYHFEGGHLVLVESSGAPLAEYSH
jgi:heat shock protein HslJ